jgi:hypothetical protein
MQVKTCDVVYDDSIRCRMLDLRCRTNIRHRMAAMSYVLRHRMLRCRTCLTYDIDIRCRTSGTYDIVGVRCRTCMTYDIVCNIGIIRCRTSDVRHRTSARIQMSQMACVLRGSRAWDYSVQKWNARPDVKMPVNFPISNVSNRPWAGFPRDHYIPRLLILQSATLLNKV